jgi:uncharacterized phiE125 gp8 family phage protein
MALIAISPPTNEPVSLEEMKAHLRVDYDDENDLIENYIAAARRKLELRCARAFVEQTWELQLPSFADAIQIPKPPTMDIVRVAAITSTGVEVTVPESSYALARGGDAGNSILIWNGAPPTGLARRPDAVRIQFTAGWSVADVPDDLKQATMFLAAHLYENRASVMLTPVRQELQEVPSTVDDFIAPYIVPRL